MDKILEALVSSSHSVPVKKAIVKKVVEAAEKEVTAEQCQALYTLTTRLIFLGEDAFQKQVGFQVLEAYARCHRSDFELFFSKDFVLGLLQQGYGPLDRKDPAVVDYIHGCLRLLISCPSVLDIFSIIQTEILRMVCERPEPALCARLATMLSDFTQCIPREKTAILFCQQLVRTIGYFHCPASQERELREYVDQVTKVSTLLQNIWKAEPVTLLPSLQEVFAIISSTDPSFDPSIALASLVQHIPLQMITVLIKSLTTDQNVKDTSMTQALCRMIDWLSWPLAHHVEMWVIALLKGLAAVQKFTILIDVTLLKIELVFNRLWYPIVRQGALVVLSHMLLSFQHSPEAFHLVVPHIVDLVQSLKHDGLPTSKAFLLHFTELVHCMMYQYSGFPDLYDDILEAIKELPGPGEEKIKLVLNQSAWTSQSNSFASGLLRLPGKSETGKTGLINLGNTCYMNSIIQTLFSATDFRRHVLSLCLNDATANTLMKKLQLLFTFLSHTQRAAYAPRVFFEASRPPWFNAGSQQDCSEYLRFLLDRLHEEEKTIQVLMTAKPNVSPGNGPSDNTGGETSAEDARVSPVAPVEGKSEGNDERTLIERMFGGRLSTGIRCMTCNSVSEKEEPFTDLSLAFCPSSLLQNEGLCQGAVNGGSEAPEIGPSPKPVTTSTTSVHFVPGSSEPPLSVPDLVDYFLAPEILDKENAYFCQKCGSLQRAERGMRVVAAPEYLILTLLRFSYDAKCHVRRKILDNVTIPPLMRLPVHAPPPKHSSSSSSPPSSPLQVDSPESSENLAKKLKPSQREEEETGLEGDNGMAGGESEVGVWPAAQFVPYVLSSVVMHSGMSSESGHYYSYGRNLNGADGAQHHLANPLALGEESGNGQTEPIALTCSGATHSKQEVEVYGGQAAGDWLLFNDSRVTFTSLGSVQNVTNRFPKDTAYVLIYRKQDVTRGQNSTGGVTANGMRLGSEPPLQKELMDAVTKDNKLFLQEQELNARTRALQAASASCSFRPNGPDDNEPPGSCGPSGGGGGGGGFNTVNRLVF
ncbi:ubiquitin carboxyl-terminal hydrolase 38-like [Oncorhynchus keta]|uniref:ubiquitin carboxyl-terminal hydrolase 38-like n=1 Tax=Oncorhynchus keta TaxID=8018 RepID=UPI00227AC2B2|nr:ubiquitin carboxyl-terminal hydrolase 38-like [Oncorhynchus keta]XP_052320741.1 ubiquitin carboxyl-terminal hydrolase 38-like [Oncorhynchus keta]XP_052320742.1 ubiquitin carboxyl-terminal hydrolase 38-like [Oncorhynchus keta]